MSGLSTSAIVVRVMRETGLVSTMCINHVWATAPGSKMTVNVSETTTNP